jgi:hypothetical protein
VPAYYAILDDIGFFIRNRKRRKANILKDIDAAFEHSDLKPYIRVKSEELRKTY